MYPRSCASHGSPDPIGQGALSAWAHTQLSARFLREARLAARVESSHLVRVFDVGRLEKPDVPYMVMELLAGRDLREELDERGPLPVDEAVDLIVQVLLGVAQVHSHGIVHRDLKPSNVFLTKARGGVRTIKVLDFGISKQIGKEGGTGGLTATEQMLGTPQYMSPEQIKESRKVDARSDVWALGVMLYELLTGKIPFKPEGDGVGELFGMIMFVEPTPPTAHRADLPAGLEEVMLKCLRREPDERFASVGELAAALKPFGTSISDARVEEIGRTLASIRPPPTATAADDESASPEVVMSAPPLAVSVHGPTQRLGPAPESEPDPGSGPPPGSEVAVAKTEQAAPASVPREASSASAPSSSPAVQSRGVPWVAVVGVAVVAVVATLAIVSQQESHKTTPSMAPPSAAGASLPPSSSSSSAADMAASTAAVAAASAPAAASAASSSAGIGSAVPAIASVAPSVRRPAALAPPRGSVSAAPAPRAPGSGSPVVRDRGI